MDLLIPLLILAGLAFLVFYSCCILTKRESRQEERELQEKQYAFGPLDLKLKHQPMGNDEEVEE